MIDADAVAKGLEWFIERHNPPQRTAKEWRHARNHWLRMQGIGGIIKEGKKSKSLPPWWGSDTKFWFITEEDEKDFTDVFCTN